MLVFLVVFVLGVILFLARVRTAVGPDGIRNRVVGREVHLPWADLEGVQVRTVGQMRTAQVVRRDGRIVTLTGLRDGPAMPDPGFDATVEAIRQWIAQSPPPNSVPQEPNHGR